MAVGRQTTNRNGPVRKIVGDFTLTGSEEQVRLTMSKKLDVGEFPAIKGQEVRVELVIEGEETGYLEVYPKDED